MSQREANFRSYFWVRGFQDSRQEIVNGTLGMLYPSPISASNRLKLSIITSPPDFVVDLLHTFLGGSMMCTVSLSHSSFLGYAKFCVQMTTIFLS
jgi:hypothetical protein